MELITEDYRRLNEELHEKRPDYGVYGRDHVEAIAGLAANLRTKDILDYGCGKGTLALHFPYTIKQYDPAIAKYSELPTPADIVVCTDVLEHIEPQLIGNVLDHIKSLTKKVFYTTVCTKPAKKMLPDGRNAHLIVESPKWWFSALEDRFDIINYNRGEAHALFVCIPK